MNCPATTFRVYYTTQPSSPSSVEQTTPPNLHPPEIGLHDAPVYSYSYSTSPAFHTSSMATEATLVHVFPHSSLVRFRVGHFMFKPDSSHIWCTSLPWWPMAWKVLNGARGRQEERGEQAQGLFQVGLCRQERGAAC